MQFDIGRFFSERRPFARRFLNAVFTENTLPRCNQRPDIVSIEGLRNSDQNRVIISARRPGSRFNALANGGQPFRATFMILGNCLRHIYAAFLIDDLKDKASDSRHG